MTVKEIVLNYLNKIGADGLCELDFPQCHCQKNDLFPCGERYTYDCVPAIRDVDGFKLLEIMKECSNCTSETYLVFIEPCKSCDSNFSNWKYKKRSNLNE